ncbi:MAG TPA: polysaccharide deacetylase family protein [Isosphaeraceae bacterium]
MSRDSLPILTYHAIDGFDSPVSTHPGRFAETIARLVEAGFVGIDLTEWIARGRPAVSRGFAVSFDDGLRSILPGLEVLQRLGVPSTVFLVTDHVGRENDWPGQPSWVPRAATLDWSEVAELSRRGVVFGSHSRTHRRLDRAAIETVERELRGSSDAIAARLGTPCRLFAYPYGASTRAVRGRSRLFEAAFGTRHALASSRDDLFDLPRIDACYLRSRRVLDRLVEGRLGPWLAAREAMRSARRAAISFAASGLW